MQKIWVYDLEAETISNLADELDTTEANIVECLVSAMEREALLNGRTLAAEVKDNL